MGAAIFQNVACRVLAEMLHATGECGVVATFLSTHGAEVSLAREVGPPSAINLVTWLEQDPDFLCDYYRPDGQFDVSRRCSYRRSRW